MRPCDLCGKLYVPATVPPPAAASPEVQFQEQAYCSVECDRNAGGDAGAEAGGDADAEAGGDAGAAVVAPSCGLTQQQLDAQRADAYAQQGSDRQWQTLCEAMVRNSNSGEGD
jgi:hypothetical protein